MNLTWIWIVSFPLFLKVHKNSWICLSSLITRFALYLMFTTNLLDSALVHLILRVWPDKVVYRSFIINFMLGIHFCKENERVKIISISFFFYKHNNYATFNTFGSGEMQFQIYTAVWTFYLLGRCNMFRHVQTASTRVTYPRPRSFIPGVVLFQI